MTIFKSSDLESSRSDQVSNTTETQLAERVQLSVKMQSVLLYLSILLLCYSAAIPVERFYPFRASAGDQSFVNNDDEARMISLSTAFPFFNINSTTLYVSNNGLISFNSTLTIPSHIPTSLPLSDNPFIAPFWADIDTRGTGTVWIRETKNTTILNRAWEDIQKAFSTPINYQPQFAFIATWDGVGYYNQQTDRMNTFQCVLVSDGSLSFAIFLYGEIQWIASSGAKPALVGVNAGDGIRQFNVSESLTEVIINITTISNIGVPGVWIFQLNGDDIPINGNCSAITNSGFVWPETPRNSTAIYTCPNNLDFSVSRECSAEGVWQNFDEQGCGMLAEELETITMTTQNLTNVRIENLVKGLSRAVGEGNEVDQTEANFNVISNTIANVTNFIAESDAVINETVIANVTQTVDSLLQWTPSAIEVTSSSMIVESFEALLSLYAQQLPVNSTQNFNFASLSLAIERSNRENFQRAGRSFAIVGETVIQVDETTVDQLTSQQNAAIRLPASLFARTKDQSDLGIVIGYYETAILFPITSPSDTPRRTQVYSNVIAATVGHNMSIQNLEEAVTITFRLKNKEGVFTASGSEMCVSWDFGHQNWTSQGCMTNTGNDGIVLCRCNHLTNFAVLVDTCMNEVDCQPQTTQPPTITTSVPIITRLDILNSSFTNLTTETVEAAVLMLAQVIQGSVENQSEQNGAVLGTTANYLMNLATFLNSSNETISSMVVENVVQVVSSLLQWNPENIVVDSSSSAIQSFEVVVYLFAQQLSLNETQNITVDSLIVVSELRSVASLSTTGRSFTIGNDKFAIDDGDKVTPGKLSSQQDAAISLPASLFQNITDREVVGIFFALYNTSTLFPVNRGRDRGDPRRREVGSRVLAATVGPDLSFQNLTENITIVLRRTTEYFTAPGTEVCVSWNFTLQDWTTEGCSTDIGEDGIITCSCNHLTNFAILVDICIRQDGCQSFNPPELTIVSYIGMSISVVSLLTTIVTLLIFKKLRQKDISKYHIQLSLAMIFMLIASFAVIAMSANNSTRPYEGCVIISVLVHYFTLAAVMWMAAVALFIFQKVMFVFHKITTTFTVSVSIICWTIPLVPTLITLIVDLANGTEKDIIIRRSNSTEALSFCFLSHSGAFWGAFLAPILAIMVFNTVIFTCVIVVLVRHTRGKAIRQKETVSRKTIIRLMISISGVMFLFGLTWLFAILTFSGLEGTFDVLFTIFNSFQGFFIFLFFCVFNKEAVESWKELLSCGKYKSKLLHPSRASSAPVNKSRQTNSGSKGQSPTPETSKSYYKSDTLTKGNVYEKVPFDSKVDLGTNSFSDNKASEQDQNSVRKVDPTEDITQDNRTSAKNGNAIAAGEKEEKKIKKTTSLKARFRRYTTVKKSKHHVEEVQVDFHSDNDSDVEENAATEL